MNTDAWNPDQYERFRDERSQPFRDLAAMVVRREDMRVVDLGCGTGELTAKLVAELGAKEALGLDSSAAMIEKSKPFAGGALRFELGDIEKFSAPPKSLDLVFSNAALHWIDDHPRLFAGLTEMLDARGQLAVQVPANHDHRSYTLAAEVAAEPKFARVLGGYTRTSPVLRPEEYAALLHHLGYCAQRVRLEVYGHVLDSRDDVVEWMKGTTLTAYETRLGRELYPEFVARYRERLAGELADEKPYFFSFKRILLWARR